MSPWTNLKLYDADNLPRERPRAVIAIGTFDGVHRGHLHILRGLTALADRELAQPMVVMFDHPPAIFFNPALPRSLITLTRGRAELLGCAGVEIVLDLEFGERFAPMKAREFLDFVNAHFDVKGLLVGYDHKIGSDMLKKDDEFRELTASVGIGFSRVGRRKFGRWTASSSLVRRMIREAQLRAASALLGRFHSIEGVVVEGEHLGAAALACPTANVLLPHEKLSPPPGVYAGIVRIKNGGDFGDFAIGNPHTEAAENAPAQGVEGKSRVKTAPPPADSAFFELRHAGLSAPFDAAINIMPARVKPVYEAEPPDRMLIEAHLLDFDGDLYGRTIEIEFVRRLRHEKRFATLDSLRDQIHLDVEQVRMMNPLGVGVPTEDETAMILDEDAG